MTLLKLLVIFPRHLLNGSLVASHVLELVQARLKR